MWSIWNNIILNLGTNHTILNNVDLKHSLSCFRGHNLDVGETALHTLSAISFFPSDKYFYFFSKFRRIICTIFLCNKKYRSPRSFKRKGPLHLLRFPLDWEYSAMFEKERMFLHFQRFQNFHSAVMSFFATNFHLFFPNHAFRNAHFSRIWAFRQGKPPLDFVACYYAQYRMRSAILRNHLN